MNCPQCQKSTHVLRTEGPWRRRECLACKHRFNTEELVKGETAPMTVTRLEYALLQQIKRTFGEFNEDSRDRGPEPLPPPAPPPPARDPEAPRPSS